MVERASRYKGKRPLPDVGSKQFGSGAPSTRSGQSAWAEIDLWQSRSGLCPGAVREEHGRGLLERAGDAGRRVHQLARLRYCRESVSPDRRLGVPGSPQGLGPCNFAALAREGSYGLREMHGCCQTGPLWTRQLLYRRAGSTRKTRHCTPEAQVCRPLEPWMAVATEAQDGLCTDLHSTQARRGLVLPLRRRRSPLAGLRLFEDRESGPACEDFRGRAFTDASGRAGDPRSLGRSGAEATG